MAEEDRIGDLHHGCLEVKGEKDVLLLRVLHLLFVELAQGAPARSQAPPTKAVSLVRDPACGTYIDRSRAMTLGYKGETHYFCSEDCRANFKQGRRAASGGA